MKTINTIQIVEFTNTNYFIYNENGVVTYPEYIPSGTSKGTSVKFSDIIVERSSMEELMEVFNNLGFVMPKDDSKPITWHGGIHSNRMIQVYLDHSNGTKLILENGELMTYMQNIGIPCIHDIDGVYIYLEELFDQHFQLFRNYRARITQKTETDDLIFLN